MTQTRAAVFRGEPGKVDFQSFATPTPVRSEVLVEVLGCTLCGSDRHTFEGRRSVPLPTILGHETLGRIVTFGPDASRRDGLGTPLALGDRVCWAIVAHCGRCPNCRRGLPQKCLNGVKYGHEAIRDGNELRGGGGLAEHCLLADGTSMFRVPEGLPAVVACPAGCATATVVAAFEAAGDLKDKAVGVFGAGLLGLTACAMAKSQGASAVVCVEPSATRRARAAQFGASLAVSAGEFCDAVASLSDGPGVDVVIELSGAPEAFEAAMPALRIGGVLVLVGGVFPGRAVGLAMEDVIRRLLTIRGVHNYAPQHLGAALQFLAGYHREIPFASAVPVWFPLSETAQAFEHARDPEVARVGVVPDRLG
jgi:putative phosphonate catabolism associated alcohol dehydrogenase